MHLYICADEFVGPARGFYVLLLGCGQPVSYLSVTSELAVIRPEQPQRFAESRFMALL